ncbi:formate dehydrogenase accessory protein FdhE [Shewanella algae]|uniref:formate dehydrogenase accessory protein FdhE n=1 Tax=Shewanella algae TaxID=38313 RepID=UPI0038B3D6E4
MSLAGEIPSSFTDSSPLALKVLITADPKEVYLRRAERLAELAKDSSLEDYLALCRSMVLVQHKLCDTLMGPAPDIDTGATMPLRGIQKNGYWIALLQQLLSELLDTVPANVAQVIRQLMRQTPEQLQQWAGSLLDGRFSQVPAEYRLFLWAALSVYWSHWAAAVASRMDTTEIKQQSMCPVCGSHPVASVVVDKPREGLRYLHCSLCETQWHFIRAHCSSCNQAKEMSLWSFDKYQTPVRIESCDDCHGYSKMLFMNLDPKMDAVADDIASMALDAKLNEKGFHATTVNPFLLADELSD